MNPPIPIQPLDDALYREKNVQVSVLRLDLLPGIAGNKFFKLKYNLEAFENSGKDWLVTVGGAWSNHVAAVADAGQRYGFRTAGIVRGEELHAASNEVLQRASANGMELFFVSRNLYRQHSLPGFLAAVAAEHPDLPSENRCWFLPEGGTNALAARGCSEMASHLASPFDVIACACGTGGTLAGLTLGLAPGKKALGIAVVKASNLEKTILELNGGLRNFNLVSALPDSTYAKTGPVLQEFCHRFSARKEIPVEPVYTGKLFYTLQKLAERNFFETGTRVLAVHTGGVQPIGSTALPGPVYQ